MGDTTDISCESRIRETLSLQACEVLCNVKGCHMVKGCPIQSAVEPLQGNTGPQVVFSLVYLIQVTQKMVFISADLTSSWENIHDLLCLSHLCGFLLSGELDLGCGGHGL